MSIKIENISKHYGNIVALDNVSLDVGRGTFGLLGPNGAGKTTLMRILATLTHFDSGTVNIENYSLRQSPGHIRKIIGYMPQHFGFYPSLTAYQMLDYIGTMKDIPKKQRQQDISALLETVNLSEVASRKVGGFSGGMRQRLGIAQALLGNPRILIVDEPTAGLDPEERIRFRNLLSRLSSSRTVLLSTHIVGDIEAVSTEIAILHKGKIVFTGNTLQLSQYAKGLVWQISISPNEWEKIEKQFLIISSRTSGASVEMRILANEKPSNDAISIEPNLEDAYLALINNYIDSVKGQSSSDKGKE